MRKWSVALAVIALIATALALYVEVFERRPSPAEALSEPSPGAEIPAQPRAEAESPEPPDDSDSDGPLPGAVLRRSESGRGSALEQVRDDQDVRETLVRLQKSLDNLTLQTDRSNQALRRDLERLQAEVRRERDVSGKVRILLLAALIPLVLNLLASLWPRKGQEPPA